MGNKGINKADDKTVVNQVVIDQVAIDRSKFECLLLSSYLMGEDNRAQTIAEDLFGPKGLAELSLENQIGEFLQYYNRLVDNDGQWRGRNKTQDMRSVLIDLGINVDTRTKEGLTLSHYLLGNPDDARLDESGGEFFMDTLVAAEPDCPFTLAQDTDNPCGMGPLAYMYAKSPDAMSMPDEAFAYEAYSYMVEHDGEDRVDAHGYTTFERMAAGGETDAVAAVIDWEGFSPEHHSIARICQLFADNTLMNTYHYTTPPLAENIERLVSQNAATWAPGAVRNPSGSSAQKTTEKTTEKTISQILTEGLPELIETFNQARQPPLDEKPNAGFYLRKKAEEHIKTYLWLAEHRPELTLGSETPTSESLEESLRCAIDTFMEGQDQEQANQSLLELRANIAAAKKYDDIEATQSISITL